MDSDYLVNIDMDQQTINEILPGYYLPNDLVMDNSLNSAEFVMSYAKVTGNYDMYSYFGMAVCSAFLVMYVVKALLTVP